MASYAVRGGFCRDKYLPRLLPPHFSSLLSLCAAYRSFRPALPVAAR